MRGPKNDRTRAYTPENPGEEEDSRGTTHLGTGETIMDNQDEEKGEDI